MFETCGRQVMFGKAQESNSGHVHPREGGRRHGLGDGRERHKALESEDLERRTVETVTHTATFHNASEKSSGSLSVFTGPRGWRIESSANVFGRRVCGFPCSLSPSSWEKMTRGPLTQAPQNPWGFSLLPKAAEGKIIHTTRLLQASAFSRHF